MAVCVGKYRSLKIESPPPKRPKLSNGGSEKSDVVSSVELKGPDVLQSRENHVA